LVAGIVLVVLMLAGWTVTFQAIEQEVNRRYGSTNNP
jgi:hypothetical protein